MLVDGEKEADKKSKVLIDLEVLPTLSSNDMEDLEKHE